MTSARSGQYYKRISVTLVGEHIYSPRKGAYYLECQISKLRFLIDGGFLRVIAKKAKKLYDPDYIERFAHACKAVDENIFRTLYYDCALYQGTVKQPVSGTDLVLKSSDAWLQILSHKDLFAVRRGVLKFRGFKPKKTPVTPAHLTDADFEPIFEQKGGRYANWSGYRCLL